MASKLLSQMFSLPTQPKNIKYIVFLLVLFYTLGRLNVHNSLRNA